MREAVKRFAEQMEEVLQKNDTKDGWSPLECSIDFLERKLISEIGEYFDPKGGDISELIDIANFCMMVWHRRNKTGLYE